MGKPALVALLLPVSSPPSVLPLLGEACAWEAALSVCLLKGKVKNKLCFFIRLFLTWNAYAIWCTVLFDRRVRPAESTAALGFALRSSMWWGVPFFIFLVKYEHKVHEIWVLSAEKRFGPQRSSDGASVHAAWCEK